MPILKAKNRAGRDIPNAVTVIHGTDLPKVDALHYNTEGQLTLGKMAAAAVKKFYKALPKGDIRSTPPKKTKGAVTQEQLTERRHLSVFIPQP